MDGLHVERLSVRYSRRRILDELSFEVQPRSTLAVVGPSGAGKTTLLRALAGLLPISGGTISVSGARVERSVPQLRHIALVFAEDALLEHRTVGRNLTFVARNGANAAEMARAFAIDDTLARRPRALSTGERRRVSLVRALLSEPRVLLLDEPLAVLDPELRAVVREELLHVRERFTGPMVLVTHDHADAMTFGDRLAVLVDGRFEDIGDPERVYDRPASTRAAGLLGARPMSLLPGSTFGESDEMTIGIRAERLRLVSDAALRGTIERRERVGPDAFVSVRVRGGSVLVRVDAREPIALGTSVGIAYDPMDLRRFHSQSGTAL